jgi:hypothetical protein
MCHLWKCKGTKRRLEGILVKKFWSTQRETAIQNTTQEKGAKQTNVLVNTRKRWEISLTKKKTGTQSTACHGLLGWPPTSSEGQGSAPG